MLSVVEKEKFLKENRGLIAESAHKYYFDSPKFSFDDLIQAGNKGALQALNKFDDSRGTKLQTYVKTAAENEISTFVAKNSYDIYIPVYKQRKNYREGKSIDDELNHPVAVRLDWENGEENTLSDVIPSGEPPVEQDLMLQEQNKVLKDVIRSLPKKEQDVIWGHHLAHLTFSELGEEMGVTKQRVKQIEKKAMKKLKVILEKKLDGTIIRADGLARR